jgi:hypothetical protein
MTCNLSSHLERNLHLARTRRESAEIKRLESDIAEHRNKCVACAGMSAESLPEKLFGRVVIVVEEGKR